MTDPRPLVLVVEDDQGVAVLQRRRLERSGFRVRVASNVDMALVALADGGVQVIVLDYRLGAETGLDLHRRMRAAGFEIPVIIVSGSVDEAMVFEAMRAGVRDVLLKNTNYLDDLPDSVAAVLRQAEATPGEAPGGAAARVLVVEDDVGTAMLERRHLERAGYQVELATSAEQALEIVRTGRITLAVIDLRLEGSRSGIDLYDTMKAEGWNIPAVLVTAFADQAAAIRAMRSGIRDFIPKSGDYFSQLPTAVERLVSQVRIERKLAESEFRLASIIGTAMDAILMCTADGHVVLFNRAAEEMFGCSAGDVGERHAQTLIPELRLGSGSTAGQAQPLRERLEANAHRCDGEVLPIEMSVSDMVVHERQLFTVIARDISERRRVEAQLREADRRKDEFLGMLAHELRNPLAAVVNAAEVLHRTVPQEAAAKPIAVIRRQAQALARMVDDLLDVSRVTLGKIQITTDVILLDQVVRRAADNARDAAEKAGVALDLDVAAEQVWVRGDATRLEQVLANLLTNATKFTASGGRISVSLAVEGSDALVRVRDTGVGIPPELLPRIFDLFVQGDTSLDRARSGLGIGLSLVRQIVSMHGGHVTAFSDGAGTGAEFTVRLPATSDRPPEAHSDEHTVTTAAEALRVLVVDDQRDIADSLAVLIRAFGHETRVAYAGAEALALVGEFGPHVVFVDIGMPGMNGYELAAQVRANPAFSAVTLVAVTGYGRDEDRARSTEAGFDLHIVKPVHETDLQRVLSGTAGEGARL